MKREIIPANDSIQENRYFFITFLVVICVAAMVLWLSGHKSKDVTRLPNNLSNLATQLSIASDEIVMLQELALLSQDPSLGELLENQLSPFNRETVTKAGRNCYVIEKHGVTLRLIRFSDQPWLVQWRTYEHHDSNQHTHNDEHCLADDNWRAVAHLANQ